MQRVELQRVLEGVDGLGKLFRLHVGGAQEIPGVGVVRIQFDDVVERVNRRLSVAVFFASRPSCTTRSDSSDLA